MESRERLTRHGDVQKHLVEDCVHDDEVPATEPLQKLSAPSPVAKTRSLTRLNKLTVLIGVYYNNFICMGFPFTLSTLYVALLDNFNTTRRETSLIQSVCIGCTLGTGLLAGIAVQKAGIKCVMIAGAVLCSCGSFVSWFATSVPFLIGTFGLLTGIGNSFVFISTNALVASTFETRRSMAMASIMVACGLGQVAFPLMLTKILHTLGWRGCFLIMSAFYLNMFVSSFVITSSCGTRLPFFKFSHQEDTEERTVGIRWKKLLNPQFVLFIIISTVTLGTTSSVMVAFMDLMRSSGISAETGLILYMVFSVLSICQRCITGILTRFFQSLGLFCIGAMIAGISVIVLATVKNYAVFVIFICLCGVGNGGMVGLVTTVPLEILGVDMVAISVGITTMMIGVVLPVQGVIVGWMFDLRESYDLPLQIFGGMSTISAFLTYIYFLIHTRHRRTQ